MTVVVGRQNEIGKRLDKRDTDPTAYYHGLADRWLVKGMTFVLVVGQ